MAEEPIELEEVTDSTTSPTGDPKTPDTTTPEDWAKLDGKSQERFQKIVSMRNDALERAKKAEEELARKNAYVPPAPQVDGDGLTQEERVALEKIKKVGGFLTKDELETERKKILGEVRQQEDRRLLDTAHDKLEGKYGNKKNYPSYDRTEIEEHMRKSGIYNPEAAFRDLYWDEIVSAEKNSGNSNSQPVTERTKPSKTTATEWDPETLGERLRKSDAKEFYLKNQSKIDKLYANWRAEGLAK